MALPVQPPVAPMEATLKSRLPAGPVLFEPKWDGFRCLAFRCDQQVVLQSKNRRNITASFPEIAEALATLPAPRFVLDGELLGATFDDLLLRLHAAPDRIPALARLRPSHYAVFDLLVDPAGADLTDRSLSDRRDQLESFAKRCLDNQDLLWLTPATRDRSVALAWLEGPREIEGIMAKGLGYPYAAGARWAMIKVKRQRSVDCVVLGFRTGTAGSIASLRLGLYDAAGELHDVGYCTAFAQAEQRAIAATLARQAQGMGGDLVLPGPRIRRPRPAEPWTALASPRVCEVRYDAYSHGRFRHGTRFVRWRPDKDPRQCTFETLEPASDG
ncbi:MAG: ATP-dependent DNA ligase [Cyanobacteria bacterium REEB65]|nr:ATP-dependent DNA ligase [Cyanobacteria bacterium REEB65]